jgi:hypothetical protein
MEEDLRYSSINYLRNEWATAWLELMMFSKLAG